MTTSQAAAPVEPATTHGLEIRSSPLVQGAAEAKRPTRWWVAWIVMFGVGVIALGGLGGALFEAVFGKSADGSTEAQIKELAVFGMSLGFLAVWVIVKERRPFGSVGFRGTGRTRRFLVGLLAGVVLLAVPVLVLLATGEYHHAKAAGTTTGSAALIGALLLMLVVMVQASTEEAITRGYLLQVGGMQLPAWVAVALTSALFAVAHVDPHPFVLANIFLVALAFSFIALGQGSLWLVCGIHTGWNWAQGNLFGVPVSGNAREVSVFAFGAAGDAPDWLTGGKFGVEGSAVTTVVLAALALVAYRYYRRQQELRRSGSATDHHPTPEVPAVDPG